MELMYKRGKKRFYTQIMLRDIKNKQIRIAITIKYPHAQCNDPVRQCQTKNESYRFHVVFLCFLACPCFHALSNPLSHFPANEERVMSANSNGLIR